MGDLTIFYPWINVIQKYLTKIKIGRIKMLKINIKNILAACGLILIVSMLIVPFTPNEKLSILWKIFLEIGLAMNFCLLILAWVKTKN